MSAFALAMGLLVAISGCDKSGSEASAPASGKRTVFVTLLPQKHFVERVAGDRFDVHVLVGQGSSEHQYDPSPKQVVALGKASAYFRIGVVSENRLLEQLHSAYPKLPIIDTRAGIELRSMTPDEGDACDAHDHAGTEHAGHGHGEYEGKDPHVWLDPVLVKTQVETIARALAQIDSANAATYEADAAAFSRELDETNRRIAAKLAPHRGREFFVYHPTYGYFADRYGLKQVAVEIEGKEPTPKELKKLIQRARAARMRTVFYQPQFADSAAKAVAEAIGGTAVMIDPLSTDYCKNLETIAARLIEAFETADRTAAKAGPASGLESQSGTDAGGSP
jgi:zinc transport system substrate-binding protein